ncbi:MAG: hypothetical protein F4X44_00065 [Gammaproteobacteria bacterium]|nr:hypothetical protein [Gammaproteobacteria bacterium]MYD78995.1 hypothetical protein [Gammaproteobacteria bacterium]
MNALRLSYAGLFVIWATNAPCQDEENSVLVQAMQDEMERTLTELQLEDESQPYFISYTVNETILASESYVLGAQDDSKFDHLRRLTTKVRVGSKSFDNSYFVILRDEGSPIGATNGGLLLPLDDDYEEIRRSLWIATDQAYKEAISQFNGKKASRATQSYARRPADFSSEEPFTLTSSEQIQHPRIAEISRVAQELSETFRDQSDIFVSSASVVSVSNKRTYLDSEGNFHVDTTEFCSARTHGETQSVGGTELSDTTSFFAKGCSGLPEVSHMQDQTVQMIEKLKQQRYAEELFVYNGPVLFEAQAAAELMNQVLFDLLGAVPLPQIGNPQFDGQTQQLTSPFLDRLNSRVFSRSFSIVNDPTVDEYNNKPLLGSYSVDAEGMPSRRTELVANGRLRTLLTSRSPIGSLRKSTGSHRGLPLPLPGNLFVAMEDAVPMDELKAELLSAARSNSSEFSVIIRKIANVLDLHKDQATLSQKVEASLRGDTLILPSVYAAKVDSEGRETPILPVVVVNFDAAYFKDILGASEERWQFDVPVSTLGATSVLNVLTQGVGVLTGADQTLVSAITPALLFEELSLRSARQEYPKLPIVSHPLENE